MVSGELFLIVFCNFIAVLCSQTVYTVVFPVSVVLEVSFGKLKLFILFFSIGNRFEAENYLESCLVLWCC